MSQSAEGAIVNQPMVIRIDGGKATSPFLWLVQNFYCFFVARSACFSFIEFAVRPECSI